MTTIPDLGQWGPISDTIEGALADHAERITEVESRSGTSVTLGLPVTTAANLPESGSEPGEGRIAQDTGHLWQWDGSTWVDMGEVKGPKGEDAVVDDASVEDIVTGPTATRDALDAAFAPVSTMGRSVDSFRTAGATDADAIEFAVNWARANDGRVLAEPGRVYTISRGITIPATPGARTVLDLRGGTLRFTNNAQFVVAAPPPFLSTTTAAGVVRKGTKVTVASAAGVTVGDLMRITSPVVITGSTKLEQVYIVSDVDTATGEVWVEGRIVGDITPAQVTASPQSGAIVVQFFHPADSFEMLNATLESPAKDGGSALVTISGVRRVNVSNVHVHRPVRTGVTVNLCGVVTIDGCSTREHGYTTKDRGYASLPTDPGALGFGYGFLATYCYLVHTTRCHSFSGWHGFDVAVGVTNALFDGCVAHKDAYGFSSHEGSWVFHVKGCQVLGGLGITSRAMELVVDGGCHFETSLGVAISGHGTHHRLIIKDSTFDLAAITSGTPAPFALSSGTYPAHCFSADAPKVLIANVDVEGVAAGGTIQSRGDFFIHGLRFNALTGGGSSSALSFKASGGAAGRRALMTDSVFYQSAQQYATDFDGFAHVDLRNVGRVGVAGLPANSAAFLFYASAVSPHITVQSCTSDGPGHMVRVLSGAATLDFFECTSRTGPLLNAGATCTIKNAFYNHTSSALLAHGGATVTKEVGNVLLAT